MSNLLDLVNQLVQWVAVTANVSYGVAVVILILVAMVACK